MFTVLFRTQLILTAVAGSAQLWLLLGSKDGTSLTWILYWLLFIVISLLLTGRSYKEKPDLETKRMIYIYVAAGIMTLFWFGAMLYMGTARWKRADTINVYIGLGGTGFTFVLAYTRDWYSAGRRNLLGMLSNPWTRMWLALTFKSMPQVSMGVQLALGIPVPVAMLMLAIGHVSIVLRIVHAVLTNRKAANNNLRAIIVSEISNSTSWWFFTYFWINS